MTTLSDDVFDAALNEIATSTAYHICSSEPADHSGIAGVTLGNYTVSGADFTNANGDTSGRKVTVGAQTGNNATGTGTASHWALTDGTTMHASGALAASKAVTSGEPFDLAAFDIELRDPT